MVTQVISCSAALVIGGAESRKSVNQNIPVSIWDLPAEEVQPGEDQSVVDVYCWLIQRQPFGIAALRFVVT